MEISFHIVQDLYRHGQTVCNITDIDKATFKAMFSFLCGYIFSESLKV